MKQLSGLKGVANISCLQSTCMGCQYVLIIVAIKCKFVSMLFYAYFISAYFIPIYSSNNGFIYTCFRFLLGL